MGDLQRQPARVLAPPARPVRRGPLGDQRGLTLIELLVVMVILGLFSTIVYQAFFPKVDQAKIQTANTQMDILGLALDNYRLDYGQYPASLADLLREEGGKGPYLQKGRVPKDPWGNDYIYEVQDGGKKFRLCCKPDGKEETCYGEGN